MKTRAATRRFRPWRGIAFLAALVALLPRRFGRVGLLVGGIGHERNRSRLGDDRRRGRNAHARAWSGTTVTLSWAASTLANGTAVSGYLVKRYNATTLGSADHPEFVQRHDHGA